MTSLNRDFTILRNWFNKNVMVLNPDKCFFFLLIGVKDKRLTDLVLTAFLLKSAKKKKNHF